MPKKTRHIIQEVVDRERANFFRKRVAKKKPVYRTKRTEDNREIERLNQLVADLRTEINFLQQAGAELNVSHREEIDRIRASHKEEIRNAKEFSKNDRIRIAIDTIVSVASKLGFDIHDREFADKFPEIWRYYKELATYLGIHSAPNYGGYRDHDYHSRTRSVDRDYDYWQQAMSHPSTEHFHRDEFLDLVDDLGRIVKRVKR